MIEAAVAALLLITATWGWRRGTLVMVFSLGGMIAGYLGAFLLFRPLGGVLIAQTSIPAVLAYPVAALILWFGIGSVAGFFQAYAKRRRRKLQKDGFAPSRLDSAGGAALGMLWGFGFAAVGLWTLMGLRSFDERVPDVSATRSAAVTSSVAERLVYVVARQVTREEILASAISVVAASPDDGKKTVETVLGDERFVQLLSNSTTRGRLASGDVEGVASYPSVMSLAGDPTFVAAADRLALLDADGTVSPEAVAEALAPIAATIETLVQDEQIRTLVTESELIERARAGDMTSLATDPRFNELARRVLEVLRTQR